MGFFIVIVGCVFVAKLANYEERRFPWLWGVGTFFVYLGINFILSVLGIAIPALSVFLSMIFGFGLLFLLKIIEHIKR